MYMQQSTCNLNYRYWENDKVWNTISCCGFIVAGHRGIILWDTGVEANSRGALTVSQMSLITVTLEGAPYGILEAESIRRAAERNASLISQNSTGDIWSIKPHVHFISLKVSKCQPLGSIPIEKKILIIKERYMYWPTGVVKFFHFCSQKLACLSEYLDVVMITEVTLWQPKHKPDTLSLLDIQTCFFLSKSRRANCSPLSIHINFHYTIIAIISSHQSNCNMYIVQCKLCVKTNINNHCLNTCTRTLLQFTTTLQISSPDLKHMTPASLLWKHLLVCNGSHETSQSKKLFSLPLHSTLDIQIGWFGSPTTAGLASNPPT